MTQRSKSELDVLFADNTSKQITPARARDLIESCVPSRGAIHFVDNVTNTVIVTQGTWTKAANTGTLIAANRFSMPSDGRLQYDGVVPVVVRLAVSLSISLATGSGDIIGAALGINGTAIYTPSIMRTKLAAAGDVQALSLLVDTTLNPGDYVELFLMNESTTADLLVSHGYLTALGFLT